MNNMTAIKINDTRQPALRYNGVIPMHSPRALEVGQIAEILTDNGEYWADVYAPDFKTAQDRAAFIVRACNAHAGIFRAWSELAYHANALANAKTKAERDAAALKVFCAIGDAKDALPELRTLSEARAALQSAKE